MNSIMMITRYHLRSYHRCQPLSANESIMQIQNYSFAPTNWFNKNSKLFITNSHLHQQLLWVGEDHKKGHLSTLWF